MYGSVVEMRTRGGLFRCQRDGRHADRGARDNVVLSMLQIYLRSGQ
jgi:hypothetical protein